MYQTALLSKGQTQAGLPIFGSPALPNFRSPSGIELRCEATLCHHIRLPIAVLNFWFRLLHFDFPAFWATPLALLVENMALQLRHPDLASLTGHGL